MPEPRRHHSGVEILDARRIRLIEGAAPQVSPEHRLAMDRVWEEAVDANPALFDGPIVACSGVTWDDPDTLVLTWVSVTYRYRALRQVPGFGGLSALFVSVVQPSTEGGLLVGRMAPWTISPHRWQLPGGAVEPPGAHEVFDDAALRRHAARELVEETGIETLPDALALFTVIRGEHENIGIIFRAPPRPASALRDQFAAVLALETAAGRDPELEEIAFLNSPAGLVDLAGPQVDYLEHVLHRHVAELPDGCFTVADAFSDSGGGIGVDG
jgi:8-oxo-dGTP pyrophosphatase MutT (NUDIX family)